MKKLLTLSIAAYKVEKYIRQTLDSVVGSKYLDLIEIFVIDDGSPDKTLDIVRNEYEKQYPDSIHAIHKENGGYGSTVNYAIEHATGKYLKLLDGDDWVETEGIDELIEFLRDNDADWVLSPMRRFLGDDRIIEPSENWLCLKGKVLAVEDIDINLYCGMWECTFKTELFRKCKRSFPEHCLYTDKLFIVYPLPFVKTVGFSHKPVYCYRLGRDGQSVTKESRAKNYRDYLDTCEIVKEYYYESNVSSLPTVIRQRFLAYYKFEVINLLLLPVSRESRQKIIRLEKQTKKKARDFYDYGGKESEKLMLMRATAYLAYWPIAKFMKNNW